MPVAVVMSLRAQRHSLQGATRQTAFLSQSILPVLSWEHSHLYLGEGESLRFRLLSVSILAAAVGLVTGCASDSPPVSDQVQKSLPGTTKQATPTATTTTVAPVRVGIFGDSISEANSPDFNSGRFGSTSWASHLGEGFAFAGGWAKSGAKTANMLDKAAPLSADVLVVIAGTNDYASGVPFNETAENLDHIVATAGVQRVIVSTVPPNDIDPEAATGFNERLAVHARARGWVLVDAMAGLRSGDRFAPGMTSDGIHPTEAGAKTIAIAIAGAIKLNPPG